MLNLLHFLFVGKWLCTHKWATIEERNLRGEFNRAVIGKVTYCRCNKCGELRRFVMT